MSFSTVRSGVSGRDDRGVVWECAGHELREAVEYGREIPGGVVDELEKRLVEGAELDEEPGAGTDDVVRFADGLADEPVERRRAY